MTEHTPSLHRLAQQARQHPTLMAGLLAHYQQHENLTESELAAFLKGDKETLVVLALCRRPRLDPAHFRADVKQIAAYTTVNARCLARLVRAGMVDEQQQQLDMARPEIVAEADRIVERWEETGRVTCVECGTESPYTGSGSACTQCGQLLIPFA